ncbi:MAG: type II toxin-antitoxin system RelE family toxin [Candidatus Gracilibacteria bacterium]
MDKINKFLKNLSHSERELLREIILRIVQNNLETLDVKKLQSTKNLYRIRKGNIRIVFVKQKSQNVLINIYFRKDAYKDL